MEIKMAKEEPQEKRSVFWYGAIGIGIFSILVYICIKIIVIVHNVGEGLGIGLLLKKYVFAHIPYSHPALDAIAIFSATLAVTLCLIYATGLIFSKQIHNEMLIKKIFIHIPVLKQIWEFFEDIHKKIHAVKNSPFVLLKDYPANGFGALGIVTGKQIFDNGIYVHAKPCVFVMYSMFLPNGPIVYPDKEHIERISTSPSLMIKLMVTYGFERPDKLQMQKDLAYYYSID